MIGNLNLVLDTKFHSPNFSQNFFAYGNDTDNEDDDKGLDYNRVKIQNISIAPSLLWNSNRGSRISTGLSYDNVVVQNTDGRIPIYAIASINLKHS
ncbi:MAG: hypothetical protein ACK5IQ_05630 [Bacteroidales bacterium]